MHFSILLLIFLMRNILCKYVEGEIHTIEDWVFLDRFCFLSHYGLFEYHIEFNEDIGTPNLLLYYDTPDQWPAIYKTDKRCSEKEAVLRRDHNQVINLTANIPTYRTLAGCFYVNEKIIDHNNKVNQRSRKSSGKTFTMTMPTLPQRYNIRTTSRIETKSTIPGVYTTTEENLDTTRFSSDNSKASYTEGWTTKTQFDNLSIAGFSNRFSKFINTTMEALTINKDREKIMKRSISQSPHTPHGKPRGRNIQCQNARRFDSSRERWWFIAISNCQSHKGIHVKYKILMTNGPPGDYWHEHLSADEFYILPVLTAFCVAYIILLLGTSICAIELKSRQLLHTTYKIFFFSVILQLFGIMLQSIAYLKYAMTGLNISKVKRLGSICMGSSETCFLLLLLLLAKGYTVTRGRLPVSSSIKLTIFMCSYVVTYTAIFIYESVVFDPGEVLYLFESPAGYALIILRIFAWCMFIYSTVFTLKHYPEKGNFYYPFNICGTLWFVAGPAFILSGNTYIDKWVRESIVCAVLLLIAFGGHLSFLILTMPSVANKNFPYHVRTTQIGVIEIKTLNGTVIENFIHHPYQPTTTIAEQNMIVPLTRRTEEIFEGMYTQKTYTENKSTNENTETELQRDRTMENVLNWTLAKNLPSLEYSQFAGSERESLASDNSRMSNEVTQNDRGLSQPNKNSVPTVFSDYVQDVPVELFTISKMVLTGNRKEYYDHKEQ